MRRRLRKYFILDSDIMEQLTYMYVIFCPTEDIVQLYSHSVKRVGTSSRLSYVLLFQSYEISMKDRTPCILGSLRKSMRPLSDDRIEKLNQVDKVYKR